MEMAARPGLKAWWWRNSGTPGTSKTTHSLNFSMPGALSRPTTHDRPARITSGIRIDGGDSWGWPWPRYSPKNTR